MIYFNSDSLNHIQTGTTMESCLKKNIDKGTNEEQGGMETLLGDVFLQGENTQSI
jgi:hypothetical protein